LYQFMANGIPYTQKSNGESYCCPIHERDIVSQVLGLIERASIPAEVVNLGGDEVVSVEEMIRYLESLTGLSMQMKTAPMASWGMKIVDNTKRKQLAGPCKVHWKDGIREILETRFPGAITT